MELSPSQVKAEEILVATFHKVYNQKSVWLSNKACCMPLIRLTIDTAKEQLHPGETNGDFKIKAFENMPVLHQLLVEQLSVEKYCSKNNIARRDVLLTIKKEIKLLQHLSQKTKP